MASRQRPPEVLALARFRDETKAPVLATSRLKAAFAEAEGDLFVDLLRISLKLIDAKVRAGAGAYPTARGSARRVQSRSRKGSRICASSPRAPRSR